MITKELIQALKKQYALNWYGIHGVHHWARVYTNGLKIAETSGANINVIKLFAVFHDSMRQNDSIDNRHGSRGGALAKKYHGTFYHLPDEELDLLTTACKLHTTSITHDNITVQTCFDADRLDLARVGIIPKEKYLNTTAAKKPEVIGWATKRSISGYVPEILQVWE